MYNRFRFIKTILKVFVIKTFFSLSKSIQFIRSNPLIDKLAGYLFMFWYGLPKRPFHFYSPLVDIRNAKSKLKRWYKPDISKFIDWNVDEQKEFLLSLKTYSSEILEIKDFNRVQSSSIGPGYGEIEAYFLYMILRQFKPSRIIEVGSGVSTYYSLEALKKNAEENTNKSSMICIEPYPTNYIKNLAKNNTLELIKDEVQNIPINKFENLQKGDILFIDSSHVAKIDSDVNFLIFEVIPKLAKGVIIHFHDILLPMPSPPINHPFFDQYLQWTENTILKSFLMFNKSFKILNSQSYLCHLNPELISDLIPKFNKTTHDPSSLWIKKVD